MTQDEQTYAIEFRGSTGEYFRIWFVNLLLTLATLGIYSAWAKVRNRKYLYGNTFLDEANFDYLANPINILAGRVLVVLLLIGGSYWAGEDLLRAAAHSVLLVLLLPWALVRSYAFNARYSSYRNIHFHFTVNARVFGKFYMAFAPLLLLVFAYYTLFIATEAALWEEYREVYELYSDVVGEHIEIALLFAAAFLSLLSVCVRTAHRLKAVNMYWGVYQVGFDAVRLRTYWLVFLLPPTVLFAAVWGMIEAETMWAGSGGEYGITGLLLFILAIYLLLFAIFALMRAYLFRLYWQGVVLPGGGRVECAFSPWELAFRIVAINYFALILSFGLLSPWAQVRKIRYLTARTRVHLPAGALEDILAQQKKKESALGSEFDAAEGMGIGIDIV